MVDAWWKDAQTHGVDQVRMLASRLDEVAMLNQLARVNMQAEGLLHGPALVNRWDKPGGRKFTFLRHEIFDWLITNRCQPETDSN